MKIYTKNGDYGKTSLAHGKQVSKSDVIIEALGSLDELNAQLGFLCAKLHDKSLIGDIRRIQKKIFLLGAYLAESGIEDKFKISKSDIFYLEKRIDFWQESLEPLRNFILPSGPEDVAICHLVRAVCRRAERNLVKVSDDLTGLDKNIFAYLNRLSDYLFVMARFLAKQSGIDEKKWQIN